MASGARTRLTGMNRFVSFFFRWLNRRKPGVSFEFGPTVVGRDKTVVFTGLLTNDGAKIARGVVVRGLLDGDEVYAVDPVDAPMKAPSIRIANLPQKPERADSSKALGDQPLVQRRKLTAAATVGHHVFVAEWPHEDDPDPPLPAEEEREWRGGAAGAAAEESGVPQRQRRPVSVCLAA